MLRHRFQKEHPRSVSGSRPSWYVAVGKADASPFGDTEQRVAQTSIDDRAPHHAMYLQ
jgi:hypothetical protein